MIKEIKEKLKWLDPFTYVDVFVIPKVNPKNNQLVSWLVYAAFAFVFAWLLYSGLGLLFGTTAPIVVVVSPSMEPVYFRGDAIIILGANEKNVSAKEVFMENASLKNVPFSDIGRIEFENNYASELVFNDGTRVPVEKNGSIIVYFSEWRKQPIIHRAVALLHAKDSLYVLTKGDSMNNNTIDQDCGRIVSGFPEKNCISLFPVPVSELQGVAVLKLPVVGCIKLWAIDNTLSVLSTGKLPQYFNGIC